MTKQEDEWRKEISRSFTAIIVMLVTIIALLAVIVIKL